MPAKILLVDDDPNLLSVLKYRLELQGYDVSIASNGHLAEQRAEEDQPNLVLLDVMMPGMDGVEVCTRLRHNHKVPDNLKIVMLSAILDQRTIDAAYAAGAIGFINKPFNFNKLIEQVARFLGEDTAPTRASALIPLNQSALITAANSPP